MAIKVQSELLELIARIRTVRSPLERMRVLTDAWRTIRELGPEERKRLARFVGGRGAERILERLGNHKGGLRPSELRTAIARARRREGVTLQDGVDLLEELLKEDGPDETPEREEPVSRVGAPRIEPPLAVPPASDGGKQAPAAPVAPTVATTAATAAAAAAVSRAARKRVREIAREVEEVPEPGAATPPSETEPDRVGEPPLASSPPSRGLAPEPEAPPPSEAEPSAVVPARTIGPPKLPDLPPLPDFPTATGAEQPGAAGPGIPEGVAGGIAAAGRADLRLRVLRDGLDGIGDEAIPGAVDAFPDGWERRRAIQALYRSGRPADIDAALALLEHLANASDRTWCALTLLDRHGDDPDAGRRIARAVPVSRVVRRVRRRE